MPSPQDRRIQLILSPTATSNTMSIFQSDHKEEILLKYKHVSVVLPFKGTSCFWSQKGSIAPLILLRAKCGFLNPGSLIPLGPYSEAMGKISLSTSTKDSLRSFSGALWLRSPSCRMSRVLRASHGAGGSTNTVYSAPCVCHDGDTRNHLLFPNTPHDIMSAMPTTVTKGPWKKPRYDLGTGARCPYCYLWEAEQFMADSAKSTGAFLPRWGQGWNCTIPTRANTGLGKDRDET